MLAIHCLLNAAVFYAVWNAHRPESDDSGLWGVVVRLVAYAFGAIDLALAGHVAFEFKPSMAPLLAFAIPGVAGLLALELEKLRKREPQEDAVADELALATDDPSDNFSASEILRAAVMPTVFYGVYWAAVLAGIALATLWFYIVWSAANNDAMFGVLDVAEMLWRGLTANAAYTLSMSGFIAAVVFVSIAGQLFLRPFKRLLKRRRSAPDAGLEALVEARVRTMWEFANVPSPKNMTFPVWVLPFLMIGIAAAVVVVFGSSQRDMALWLMQQDRGPIRGWFVFHNSTTGLLYVMVAAAMTTWSLWHFIIDRWSGAAAYVMTLRYQRNGENVGTALKGLRRSLRRLVKKTGDVPFDPRTFLLTSRRRSGRWLYAITAVAMVAGAWGGLGRAQQLYLADGARYC